MLANYAKTLHFPGAIKTIFCFFINMEMTWNLNEGWSGGGVEIEASIAYSTSSRIEYRRVDGNYFSLLFFVNGISSRDSQRLY